MAVLDDVKELLDAPEEDDDLDIKLGIIIKHKEKKVLSYLPSGIESVPEELEHIVCDLVLARFNRIGNEGMSSYSQEGESITYEDDEMEPYLDEIDRWIKKQQGNKRGVLRFI